MAKKKVKNHFKTKKIYIYIFLIVRGMSSGSDVDIRDSWHNDGLIKIENSEKKDQNIKVTQSDLSIENKGIVRVSYTENDMLNIDGRVNKGNGLNINSGLKNINIDNRGIISGQISLIGGKVFEGTIVNANSVSVFSSNGIFSNESDMRNIKNSGIISGKAILTGGISNVTGYADSLVYGSAISNGISFNRDSVENIENSGIISGKAILTGGVSNSGSQVYSINNSNGVSIDKGNIEGLKNIGIISGYGDLEGGVSNANLYSIGYADIVSSKTSNGLMTEGKIGRLENAGIISGKTILNGGTASAKINPTAYISLDGTSNGVLLFNGTGENIENSGVIEGYIRSEAGKIFKDGDYRKEYEKFYFSGNGVSSTEILDSFLLNTGVIKGSQSAIAAKSINGTIDNYGVMAGREIFSDGIELIVNDSSQITKPLSSKVITGVENNYGTYIKLKSEISTEYADKATGKVELDSDGDVIVESILFGKNLNGVELSENNSAKTILNANIVDLSLSSKDSFIDVNSNTAYEKHIINGAGIKKGVLDIKNGVTIHLVDSTVNGYKTAIRMENNTKLIATNTIFNGGGLENKDATIVVSSENEFSVTGKSSINGKVEIVGNNSVVTIGNDVMINGDIAVKMGTKNILNLGDDTPEELRLFHKMNGFDTINTEGKVIVYESAEISTGDIHIKNGNLIVRIDGSKVDSEGKVTGHALYNHKGDIIIENREVDIPLTYAQHHAESQLVFKTSGLNIGTVIAMDGTDITNLYDPQIGTMSLIHTARKDIDIEGNTTGDVIIDILNFDEILTPKPDGPQEDEIQDKDSLGDIYDSIVKGDQIPNLAPTIDLEDKTANESLKGLISLLDQIYGNNPYGFVTEASWENLKLYRDTIFNTKFPKLNEWIIEGKGIYGLDEYVGKYSKKLNTTGLIGIAQYGVKKDNALGFLIGSSHQKLDLSMSSDLKGNTLYLGIFGKRKYNGMTLLAGIGYQYGDYDAKRIVGNNYQIIDNRGEVKTNSLEAYLETKYTFENKFGRKIEPKLRISQSYIGQRDVSEKVKPLSIDTDKKSYVIPQIELGIDYSKVTRIEIGKLTTKLGIGLSKSFGKEDSHIIGRMKNSSNFKISGSDFNDEKLKFIGVLDLEKINGIFYNFKLGLDTGKDIKKEINMELGIGYKF